MDKTDNPYAVMLERLHLLDRSIHVLSLVNNDLRQILHKKKPLPLFIRDSLKRSITSKSKTSTAAHAAPPPPPTETEEMRLAASVIDKARRTIENVGEKKPKQPSTAMPPVSTTVQSNAAHTSRPKTVPSVRLSSASSILPTLPNPPIPQQQQPAQQVVRRYVPAHVKAPFLTQPEKKRRPSSSVRNSIQTNSDQRSSVARRSASQQRRLSSTTQSTTETVQQAIPVLPTSSTQNKTNPTMEDRTANGASEETDLPDLISVDTTTGEPVTASDETHGIDVSSVPQPLILNRALIKPLRRLWKQNHVLRSRLKRERDKRSAPVPSFIDRLNEQIHLSRSAEKLCVPNIEVVLQLAIKLRSIVLHLLENSTFDDLDSALRRLNTLKYLVNQYQLFFTPNTTIFVAKQHQRPANTNINTGEWLRTCKPSNTTRNTIRYSDDSQLIAFTEVRFKQFENECRWIELSWHEQMIVQFKQTMSSPSNSNPLQIYRELMSLVTGLQASTPIVVENRTE